MMSDSLIEEVCGCMVVLFALSSECVQCRYVSELCLGLERVISSRDDPHTVSIKNQSVH